MNEYLKNLVKLEFVVTDACTGRCKHCSEGEHKSCGVRIDAEIASDAVREITERYDIKTVLAFGGEPLLHVGAVEKIIRAAKEASVPKRQIITNGYFSVEPKKIREVAELLADCGVNDLLLSVDAFHQETIPLDVVRIFATETLKCGIPIRLQPAWLVSPTHENPYNRRTRGILEDLSDLMIPVSEGNVVFSEGNALKYLGEYFTDTLPENPYIEDPCDVKCLSFSANGDLLDGNVYKENVLKIIEGYTPQVVCSEEFSKRRIEMKRVYEFLKKAEVYYLATVEGEQPRVRPFGTVNEFEGRLYIQTGKVKPVSHQISENPKVEICAFCEGAWVRVACELVEDDRLEAKKSMLDAYPNLRGMYDENDGNTQVFYLKNATAVFSAFGKAPEAVEF